ncbi:MAG: cupin domain-containing protein [Opitutaceae bacterium]
MSDPHPAASQPSRVFAWNALEVLSNTNGAARPILDRATSTLDRLEAHISTVAAGVASHPPHRHPDEEIVFVKEGILEITINGEFSVAPAGSFAFFASNDLHGMRNTGDAPATYLVIRWTSPGHEGPRPPSAQAGV